MIAAHWAVGEARMRHVPLRLVHAWVMLPPVEPGVPEEDVQGYWARRIVRDAAKQLREDYPGVVVEEAMVAGDPAEALLAETERSQVLALGSRGIGPVSRFFVGSLAQDVVARADGPTVLVRSRKREGDLPVFGGDGDVVVALRLHQPCEDLLDFAFDAAQRRGSVLRAVHSRTLPRHAYAPWAVDPRAAKELAEEAGEQLRGAVAPWRKKYLTVRVIEDVALESPARAVVRAAESAELLVVGRQRKPAALAPHLGTVVHAAIHHALCPVAVVPHD
ncbi:universal stress protein [Wenjunlia tyrosinilytica]|jgi:nucleotide-binding universal stress UspA family protein|uniref:Universal stress protein n=2 Tax=Wenjunlia tyrosinilytica TaxID=1544741 RepID=A0A917ZXW2_9ACTN|nr:universal stress protein [Wenjunlia tyrosinilytica]